MSLRNHGMRLGVLALVAALVVSLGAPAVYGIGVDTENSTTSSTSDITDGSTISLNATSSDKHKLQVTNATENAAAEFMKDIDDDGDKEVVAEFSGFTQVSGDHYKRNITDSEIRHRLPVTDDGQADSFTVELINDSTADNPATTNITVSTNATGVSTVEAVGDDVETEEADTLPLIDQNLIGPDKTASYEASDVPVSSGGMVIIEAENSSFSSEMTGIVPEDVEGGAILPATVMVNDAPEEVYYKEAPDGVEGTYTVLQEDGDIEVHLSDDFDEDSVDVSAEDTSLSLTQAFNVYGYSLDALDAAF